MGVTTTAALALLIQTPINLLLWLQIHLLRKEVNRLADREQL